ncbi:hypothetical protein CAEBREN_11330 [Caenorhabditis brenneri]|uniref:Uncharacterized protein n=1 Tax=Caenorhabditis brenneri TaxID=135651 RepID=G0N0Z9_CAEBE|nr:hypothetical protein CAEBREN_11330 [Caenorhabditis brenneri]
METDENSQENRELGGLEEPFLSKYRYISDAFEEFFRISQLGDLNAIYRNRGCFVNEKIQDALVQPAIDVFLEFPAARTSVYYYTGLLVHEYVHYWFNEKENVTQTTDINVVKDSTLEILDFYIRFFADGSGKGGLEEILQWLCELSAELSLKNVGRPAMAHAQQNGEILAILKSNEVVEKMLSLMNMIVTTALDETPDGCMRALFASSRHGQHFSWIWLHIATFLQGTIITPLLDAGAEQFRIYVADLTHRKTVQTGGPAVLNIIQMEYDHKFQAISDVFNFLMGKRNPELQEAVSRIIVNSLDTKVDKPSDKPSTSSTTNRLGFAFFFKLVTCSLKTLQILVNSNCHLITPFNVIRAIRHVQTVDKSIILPSATYTDFIKQIVGDVDPVTHGIIFELLIELIYNPNVFDGENIPELQEQNQKIISDCFPVLNVMIDRIVRVSHSAGGNKCASLHPAIQLYSSGEKLQFIIDSVERHTDKTSSIIRHLHAMSVAADEMKAAEIALRFLMTTPHEKSDLLYVLMAFLKTTVPIYPKLMTCMWREFSGLKIFIEQSFDVEDTARQDKFRIHKNLLRNVRTILDWEFNDAHTPEGNAYSFWEIYPGQYMGPVLNSILSESNKYCYELMEANRIAEVLDMYRYVTMFMETVRLSNNVTQQAGSRRFIVMTVSEMYKLMTLLAIMLKSTLMLVKKEQSEGIVIFEELRSKCLYFMFGNHLDPKLAKFAPLFLNFFVTACFIDSKKLFNERIGETMETLIDESGLNKLSDMDQLVDGPSILDSIRSMKMHDTAVDMLHKGQLKRRRKNDESGIELQENEDAMQRVHVILDVINLMCNSGIPSITLACSKQLALALVQAVCKDSLMMDMRFEDWDSEAEFIHRHVEITQRLVQSPLCDGLLRILSGTRSFAYCLPIMKSKLTILLNETEKFPDHRTIAEPIRQQLHNFILLAHKGGLLPQRFVYICDLEKYATCHETYLMLVEIWRFFMFRNITLEAVDNYHNDLLRNMIDEGLPNEKEAIDKVNLSVFRIIIQNHLPATVPLYPKLFPAEYDNLVHNRPL